MAPKKPKIGKPEKMKANPMGNMLAMPPVKPKKAKKKPKKV